MRIENHEMPAIEGLAHIHGWEKRIMVRRWNDTHRHYAFRVTKDGRIMTRYGEMKWAQVQTIDGSNPMVTFSGRDFDGYKVSSFKVED
jgi:hypothetical protein